MTCASSASGAVSREFRRATLTGVACGVTGDPRAWTMRSIRALVFAFASLALAVSAHRLAGGLAPTSAWTGQAAGALFLIGLAVAARELRFWQIATLVATTQVVLHALLPSHAGRSTAQWARLLFCEHGSHAATTAQVAAARSHFAGAPHSSGGPGMLAAHLVAAAVMAWWLRRGERAAWRAVQRVVSRLVAVFEVVTPVAPPAVLVGVWAPVRRLWGTGLAGRAPPRWAVLVLPTA